MNEQSAMLKCTACKQYLPVANFSKGGSWAQRGYDYKCKECQKISHMKRIQAESYKAYHTKAVAKSIKKYPERQRARILAQRANLKKDYCEKCGDTKRKLHMHHFDYSKPLDVITVCFKCHYLIHEEQKS